MSGKQDRERRREERLAAETNVSTKDRRARLLQFGAGAVFIVIAVVVVLIVVSSSDSKSGGDAQNLKEVAEVDNMLEGIPQKGLTLGEPNAPVELIEYGDLQCPICKEYSEKFLPGIIQSQVRQGQVKITFRNFTIISQESVPAGTAALAAGAQGRGWNYIELFYRNQGEEHSGYVTNEFMTSIAKGAGVKDIPAWEKQRNSSELEKEVEGTTSEASAKLGFTGTPSFAIKGPSTNGMELLGTLQSTADFEEAIEDAG